MSAIIRLWQEPVPGYVYAIGGDPGLGYSDSDDSVLNVQCGNTGEQVAEVQGKLDGNELGEEAFLLGMWYNEALIGIENNKDLTSLNVLFKQGYRNLYFERAEQGKAYRTVTDRLGWNTNLRTRPILVAQGRKMMEDGSLAVNSRQLLQQWEHFVLENGKFQGLKGAHDDLVMAFLISLEMMRIALMSLDGHENALAPLYHGEPIGDGVEDTDAIDRPRSERLAGAALDREPEREDFPTTMGNLL